MSGLKEVGGHGIPDTSTRDGTRRRRPCEAATHRTESGGAARESLCTQLGKPLVMPVVACLSTAGAFSKPARRLSLSR